MFITIGDFRDKYLVKIPKLNSKITIYYWYICPKT